MKCGTTTVHEILNSHPDIGIPKTEINFFDIDDTLEHGIFFFMMKIDGFSPTFKKIAEPIRKGIGIFLRNSRCMFTMVNIRRAISHLRMHLYES